MPFLLLTIRFHDGRYHGVGDWPPSPARVFQALVAAAARGKALPDDASAALSWLETLDAPIIAAPVARATKAFVNWVPNNDLDAVGGDVKRIGEIRAGKTIRPRLFDAESPLLYAWTFEETDAATSNAKTIGTIAENLYQLGRGVDMAWAVADILDADEADERLRSNPGAIYRPATGAAPAGGRALAVPMPGSLASLSARYNASATRFKTLTKARKPTKKDPRTAEFAGQLFSQPPKTRFRQVAYDCPATRLLFDLSPKEAAWPFTRPSELVELVRDLAAKSLSDALPDEKAIIDRVFIGGKDSSEADKAARIRIVPLPSIGHGHADHSIRRVLIDIPPNCPITAADIEWAFSGLSPRIDEETGEILLELIPASARRMLEHYGIEKREPSRLWRTITPTALPAARRRIDPKRIREEEKGGKERAEEEKGAAHALHSALRHVGVATPISSVRVQREPFEAKGARADAFAPGTRFPKERLWHAEIAFTEPVAGPLVIGDGRYLGLGLLQPAKQAPETAFVFEMASSKPIPVDRRIDFLRAVRRALMALDRDHGEGEGVSRLFSGHEDDGAPARSGTHQHVFLAATGENGVLTRLFVLSPKLADRRTKLHRVDQARFSEVARKLEFVRAGELGVIKLVPTQLDDDQSPICRSRVWESETSYIPTRHIKSKDDPAEWLADDVLLECARRGISRPEVEILSFEAGGKSKPNANLKLVFQIPVKGPILLGQGAHFGSGLFRACV